MVKVLSDHALTKSHSRHLSFKACKDLGLNVTPLEKDNKFQELVLSVHHACMYTLARTNTIKIIENHKGIAFIQNIAIPNE